MLPGKCGERTPPFIVLLSRYFDGPTCRRTFFAPIYKNKCAGIYLIRVEACAIDPGDDERSEVHVDLAPIRGHGNRRRTVLEIAPTP